MTDWLILVESDSDLKQTETPHKVMRVSDYLANPTLLSLRASMLRAQLPEGGYVEGCFYCSFGRK